MRKIVYVFLLGVFGLGTLVYLPGCGKGNAPVIISIKGGTK
jgi:hypothetical protein